MCNDRMKNFAPVVLRFALAVVFLYHGYGKVFGPNAGLGATWMGDKIPTLMQVLVSWGEILCGLGFLFGFMTAIASLGTIVIMLGAIFLVHGSKGFGAMGGGFEYNFVLIAMCLALIATGSGPWSIDSKFCKKADKSA